MRSFVALWLLSCSIQAFQPWHPLRPPRYFAQSQALLYSTATAADPQVFSSGYSSNGDLIEALHEAVEMAVKGLPAIDPNDATSQNVDLAIVSVSSLYDGGSQQPASVVVPTVIETARSKSRVLLNLMGCSVAGCISSRASEGPSCELAEFEGTPAVSVTLCVIPATDLKVFHVSAPDLPDDYGRFPATEWKRVVGLSGVGESAEEEPPVFLLLPSPAFSTQLDDLLQGLDIYFPECKIVGGIASTVSSLSRAKLYKWCALDAPSDPFCFTDGCIGVAATGDLDVQSMTAQGAKPVGGIYQILKAQDSTISVIVLDEDATAALEEEGLEDDEEDEAEDEEEEDADAEDSAEDAKARLIQTYAKARIPKPPLAEANFLMRSLSDDDQAFMRRQLLIGIEQGGSVGRTASELARLAEGEGHRFTVRAVASAGMKDGSVTFPLGSVNVTPGTRMRYFVRESDFAKKEVEALWTGYKKRALAQQFEDSAKNSFFNPSACLIIPSLDRGTKFFLGKAGYESRVAVRMLPCIASVAGFYSNGSIGKMNLSDEGKVAVQGSASGYILLGSRSGRPVYSALVAAAQLAEVEQLAAEVAAATVMSAADDAKRSARTKTVDELAGSAPRKEDGELLLRRREIHSGRAMTVSTVEWSVAEKTAAPTSILEGYMWDKETEVDRFRERVPLANLVSQFRLSSVDPTTPKPRDWIGPVNRVIEEKGFAIIPECKRIEPVYGSLRKRYELPKLVREMTLAGAPAISVNCDQIIFGGSLEDVTNARQASSAAAVESMSDDGVVVPPILAADLLLYPYQLYKLRLAGADAVTLLVGALEKKDLMYLTKIASSLQLQVIPSVTSEVQIQSLSDLSVGSFAAVVISNRELEDFSFDTTGQQALTLLKSAALKDLLSKHGDDIPVFVDGQVGLIERESDKSRLKTSYLKEIKAAGANGAIVGSGLAMEGLDAVEAMEAMQSATR